MWDNSSYFIPIKAKPSPRVVVPMKVRCQEHRAESGMG